MLIRKDVCPKVLTGSSGRVGFPEAREGLTFLVGNLNDSKTGRALVWFAVNSSFIPRTIYCPQNMGRSNL